MGGIALAVGLLMMAKTAASIPSTGTQAPRDASPSPASSVVLRDDLLREWAIVHPTPAYPPKAQRDNITGVVVVKVSLDSNMRIHKLDVLESPSEGLATAVTTAVADWQFKSRGLHLKKDAAKRLLTGTLTFYFYRSEHGYKVSSPKDAPIRRGKQPPS